ncbi:MAG: hypothetical protein K1V84_10025 [Muribaculaceae bacterium]
MITTFGPLFYITLVCLLFPLAFILVMAYRYQLWLKRSYREIKGIRSDANSSKEELKSSILDYLDKELPEAIKPIIRDMVKSCVKEEIDKIFPSPEISVEPREIEGDIPLKAVEVIEAPSVGISIDELEDVFLSPEKAYTAQYLKKPDVSMNEMGIKRVSVSPDFWYKLNLLSFVKEDPVSVSAIVQNILAEHFICNEVEIDKLTEIGRKNMKYGYGRY